MTHLAAFEVGFEVGLLGALVPIPVLLVVMFCKRHLSKP
jgi:hypothetical protein